MRRLWGFDVGFRSWVWGFRLLVHLCCKPQLKSRKLPFEVIAAEFADVGAALQSAQLCAFAAAGLVETPRAAIGMHPNSKPCPKI